MRVSMGWVWGGLGRLAQGRGSGARERGSRFFAVTTERAVTTGAGVGEVCDRQLIDSIVALELLVQQGSFVPYTVFYNVLKRCTAQRDLVLGRHVHALALQSGYESNIFLANHIIRMYAFHGRLEEARQVFAKVPAPNAHMWASIVLAHARHGQPRQAIALYRQMLESVVKPDNHVFVAVLKACATAVDLAAGKEVHSHILESAVAPDKFVCSCLVDMYAKCGSLEDARRVFDNLSSRDVVTWNAMIAGYAQHGLGQEALDLYASMRQGGKTAPTEITFVCVLQACASLRSLHQGKELHFQIQKRGLEGNVVVGCCLVEMYAKCGDLEEARRVFDRLPTRNVVTWNTMIAGYAQHGLAQEAFTLYARMQQEGSIAADHLTFVWLLKACASVGALSQGKKLHAEIQQRGLEADMVVGTNIVDMYAKCGSLKDARKVFDMMSTRDVMAWTALLDGYALHSDSKMAMQCFEEMLQQGVEPDHTTFACLLVACSHGGLVNEGQRYFGMMADLGIAPDVYNYTCLVDLLGRSGHLDEAENVLRTMPFDNDVVGWKSLLSACKSHGDINRGKRCFDHVVEREPENAAAYVLLGNIYANAGRWKDVHEVESLRKSVGAKKKPARACIEVKNAVHEFTVGEDRADISSKLRSVNVRLKEEGGHVPHTDLVLKAVSQQEKEDELCGHAEKLALAYGLLHTPDGTTLLVTKNLRMCNDCHSSTKIMSQLEKREIIVRDAHRVHRFVHGSCSCGDWH